MTFKNEKYQCYEDFKDGITLLSLDKDEYKDMMSRKVSITFLSNGISMFMGYMNKHYGKKVILLIDEYYVPIQEAYIKWYYDEMMAVIRTMLTSALKDNINVERAFITGILRVAKESIYFRT